VFAYCSFIYVHYYWPKSSWVNSLSAFDDESLIYVSSNLQNKKFIEKDVHITTQIVNFNVCIRKARWCQAFAYAGIISKSTKKNLMNPTRRCFYRGKIVLFSGDMVLSSENSLVLTKAQGLRALFLF